MRITDTPFYLNAADPGGLTGLALLHITPDDYRVLEQCTAPYRPAQGNTPTTVLEGWRQQYDDLPHVLVYEAFTMRPTNRTPDTTAISVLGELEAWIADGHTGNAHLATAMRLISALKAQDPANPALEELGDIIGHLKTTSGEAASPYCRVITQEPVQAKQLVKDPVLHRLGLKAYGAGSVHINDAFRHAATWLATIRYRPICLKGWPPKTG